MIFSNLSENHTSCKQIRNSGQKTQTTNYFIETLKHGVESFSK